MSAYTFIINDSLVIYCLITLAGFKENPPVTFRLDLD